MAKKTWRQRYDGAPEPSIVPLEKDLWGMKAGARLAISSPKEIESEIRKLGPGEKITISDLRARLAQKHGADAACPLTTSMFRALFRS